MALSTCTLVLINSVTLISPAIFYVAVGVFTGIILILIVCMVGILVQKKRKDVRRKSMQAQMKDWLVEIILEEPDETHQHFLVPENIQTLLKQDLAKEELLNELKVLKKGVSGQPGKNIELLYRQLGLNKISVARLRNRQWNIIAKGIQDLAIMNQSDTEQEIFTFINHRHPIVRMEAQIALVFLHQYQGLRLFENLVYPLTEWHQIKLLELLGNYPIPSEEAVCRWLQSPNASVVQFALKLIGAQHAGNFLNEVIACLSRPEEVIRRQAIACLGEIPSNLAANALLELFAQETNKNLQLAILSEIVKTGTDNDLAFFRQLQETIDPDIRLLANKALLHLVN